MHSFCAPHAEGDDWKRGREYMLLTLLFSFTACHKIILSKEKSKTVETALIFMWQVLPLQTYGRSFISMSGFYHRVRCTLTYEWMESFLLSVSVNVKPLNCNTFLGASLLSLSWHFWMQNLILHQGFLKRIDPEYEKGRISLKIDHFNFSAILRTF